ncbi:prefoldin subunit 1 [Orussus abietinus]|uniref:prefoldin subunit 1 n=1 Tax=Orussus abietinus TaxID=222816 RepID=UPI0006251613|nr:prefoldin subunit 1 [Orussus abietinus]
MAREPDEELKKAFAELQRKLIDTSQKQTLTDLQIDSLQRTMKRAKLTVKEVTTLPPNTRLYESVGRMFLLDDIDNIKEELEKRVANAEKKITTLENSKTFLQQSLKDSENHLREMVQQRQSKEASG